MAHLGELIAELRQDRGLTQKELGDILCVSSGTISNYENGVHLPDVDKVIALANYFHVTTDYLLGRTSSNLPVELLQQAITNEKTLGDVMASFAKLPANRQAALSLIISDMEVRQMIDTYSRPPRPHSRRSVFHSAGTPQYPPSRGNVPCNRRDVPC